MREIVIKIYWALTIISQVFLLIVIYRNIPHDNIDTILISCGIALILFSWIQILSITNLMITNDEISNAFSAANEKEKEWDNAVEILKNIALAKMGVTSDEISKRMKGK